MSKWTIYQLLIVMFFTILITLNNLFKENVLALFSFYRYHLFHLAFSLFSFQLFWLFGDFHSSSIAREKKKELFVHKIWRIMPAIIGVLLVLSIVVFLVLFLTVLTNVNPTMHWMLDLITYLFTRFILYVRLIAIYPIWQIGYNQREGYYIRKYGGSDTNLCYIFLTD